MCIFFFNDTATTEIYTLSLHDALPISALLAIFGRRAFWRPAIFGWGNGVPHVGDTGADETHGAWRRVRSEEHTSELQSRQYLVCRLLLEKKKTVINFLQLCF